MKEMPIYWNPIKDLTWNEWEQQIGLANIFLGKTRTYIFIRRLNTSLKVNNSETINLYLIPKISLS